MSNAQAAHKSGQLDAERWEEMRRRFNRLQERSVSLFGKDSLQQALRTFSPSTYKLPGASAPAKPLADQHADSSATAPVVVRRLPSSCPHSEEELIRKAGEFPNLVACPVGVPPWWWVAKTKCATNCSGHPDCIRNLYWSEEWFTQIEEKRQ